MTHFCGSSTSSFEWVLDAGFLSETMSPEGALDECEFYQGLNIVYCFKWCICFQYVFVLFAAQNSFWQMSSYVGLLNA